MSTFGNPTTAIKTRALSTTAVEFSAVLPGLLQMVGQHPQLSSDQGLPSPTQDIQL
jgi:hypothetical protein